VNIANLTIKTAPFPELTAVPAEHATNTAFDIIIDDKITLVKYCSALVEKLFVLPQSQFRKFIDYHCGKTKNQETWLNKLEKLIANNEKLFVQQEVYCRFTKLYGIIEIKRIQLEPKKEIESKPKPHKRCINAESEERYFSFYEKQTHVESLHEYEKQIIFLTKEKFAYKKADLISKNSKLQDYGIQCENIIEELKTLRGIQIAFEKETRDNIHKATGTKDEKFMIQIDGPINILTHAFKQFMFTLKPNGRPYMDYPIEKIVGFLCENFLDENGKPFSVETIRTYLRPGRTDKDPNNDMTIKF
jgi:hypothetical protein